MGGTLLPPPPLSTGHADGPAGPVHGSGGPVPQRSAGATSRANSSMPEVSYAASAKYVMA